MKRERLVVKFSKACAIESLERATYYYQKVEELTLKEKISQVSGVDMNLLRD